jgi:hypothetical protein
VLSGLRQHTINCHILISVNKGTPIEALVAGVLEFIGGKLPVVSGGHQHTTMVHDSHLPAALQCLEPVHATIPGDKEVVVSRVQGEAGVPMTQNDTRG